MNKFLKNKKVLILTGLVLLVVITYNLYNFCTEYFDKDGRFVLAGKILCPNISSATLMSNGNVFIISNDFSNSEKKQDLACKGQVAQIYDPNTGKTKLIGKPKDQRGNSLIPISLQDGEILILNGEYGEIYDYRTNKYILTGKMIYPRTQFSAKLLLDGKVLVIGGAPVIEKNIYDKNSNKKAEIYDPKTGKFTSISDMNIGILKPHITILKDGKVLIFDVSGNILNYNPETKRFNVFDKIKLFKNAVSYISVTVLDDGRLLIVGEENMHGKLLPIIYNPYIKEFVKLDLNDHQYGYVYVEPLLEGKVLIAGGGSITWGTLEPTLNAEIFDLKTMNIRSIKTKMKKARHHAITVNLKDGRVLFLNGYFVEKRVNNPEMYVQKN